MLPIIILKVLHLRLSRTYYYYYHVVSHQKKLFFLHRLWRGRRSRVDFIKVGHTAQIIEIALLKLGRMAQSVLYASKKLLKSWA